MAAERFSLIIDSRTSGQAEVDKLTESVRKLGAEVLKSQQNAAKKSGEPASAGLGGIQQTITAAIQNPAESASAAVDALIGKLGSASPIAGGLAAGVAALAGVMFTAAEATGSLAEQQSNNALRLGVSVKEYGLLSQAAKEAGLDADGLVVSMKTLSKSLTDSSDAGDKGQTALRQLGIEAKNVHGSLRPMNDLLFDIADALGKIEEPAKRDRMAIDLLGKGGLANLPLLNSELRNTVAELDRLGVGFDEKGVKVALRFDNAMDRLGTRLDVLKRKFGELAASAILSRMEPGKPDALVAALLASPAGLLLSKYLENTPANAPTVSGNRAGEAFVKDQDAEERDRKRKQIQAFLGADPRHLLDKAKADLQRAIEDDDVKGAKAAKSRITQLEAEIAGVEKLKALKESILELESKSGISAENKIQLLGVAEDKEIRRAREAFAGRDDIARIKGAFENQRIPLLEELLSGARDRGYAASDATGRFDSTSGQYGKLLSDSQLILNTLMGYTGDGYMRFGDAKFGQASLSSGRNPSARDITKFFLNPFAGGMTATNEAMNSANAEGDAAKADRAALRAQMEQAVKLEKQKLGLDALREEVDYETRKVELLAGPGGEIAAIRTATALRLAGLEQQKALGVSNLEIEKQRLQIVHEGELRILEAIKQRRMEMRDSYGQIFDAITTGQGGIQQYAKGLVLGQGRTIFQNVAEQLFGTKGGKFQLPGVGTAGSPTFLGKILQGTSFGADPLKNAMDQNTAATIANTQAQLGGGGAVPRLFAAGVASGNPMIFSQNAGGGGMGAGSESEELLSILATTKGKGGFSGAFGKAAGFAASAGAIYGGIRQGGFGGAITAAGGATGAAGLIAQLAGGALGKTLGQALPGLGLALGLIGSLVGSAFDPKKKRSDEIDTMIANNAYKPGVGQNYGFAAFDYDKRGQLRIDLTVNALDASSILDRKSDIAEAVRQAVDQNHPLNDSMREALMPA